PAGADAGAGVELLVVAAPLGEPVALQRRVLDVEKAFHAGAEGRLAVEGAASAGAIVATDRGGASARVGSAGRVLRVAVPAAGLSSSGAAAARRLRVRWLVFGDAPTGGQREHQREGERHEREPRRAEAGAGPRGPLRSGRGPHTPCKIVAALGAVHRAPRRGELLAHGRAAERENHTALGALLAGASAMTGRASGCAGGTARAALSGRAWRALRRGEPPGRCGRRDVPTARGASCAPSPRSRRARLPGSRPPWRVPRWGHTSCR